jgi:hypothetical protein
MTAEDRNSGARETTVANKELGKYFSTAMNTHTAIEERLNLNIT